MTVDPDAIKHWAEKKGKPSGDYATLTRDPELRAEIQAAFDEVNKGLNRYETIKKFAILERDFTIEGGELTPSQKVRRKHVETQYKDLLDGFYAGAMEDV